MCQSTIDEILAGLLGVPYVDEVSSTCQDNGDVMVATAQATFRGFAPLVPDLTIDFEALAAREQFVQPVAP